MFQADKKLLVWASDFEPNTIEQASRASRLPFVDGHVALMADAHLGKGATIGSVIPTTGAIIPSAIGVDIGCGMVASLTDLVASDLPDNLDKVFSLIEQRIPAGVGQGHTAQSDNVYRRLGWPYSELSDKQITTAECQLGTLGSGNHFVEVCLDELDRVWTVLHSGSRGIGNQLATKHIERAKGLMARYFIELEDPDLAYLVEGSTEFDNYIADMLWAQDYAMESRAMMSIAASGSVFDIVGHGRVIHTVNCHHNFTRYEHHNGKDKWITRKGAIKADVGDAGIIPGSMGTATYIVSGLGSKASYNSCSHGAGRRMSRGQARRELTAESLTAAMQGRTWNAKDAAKLVDEHPQSYKDIRQVMEDQKDLCHIEHTLHSLLNYKGSK